MNRRILALAAMEAVLGLVLLLAVPDRSAHGASPAALAAFAAAFAVIGSLPVHLELRRGSLDVVLDEAVWIVALFHLPPAGLVLAVVAGEALARVCSRRGGVKAASNVATALLAAAAGAVTFAAVGLHDSGSPAAWLAAAGAMTVMSATSLLCVSVVLAMVERRRLGAVLSRFVDAPVTIAANASLGLAAVALLRVNLVGPLILAPVIVPVVLASRRHTQQAAEQLRFERLYAAAARTSGLLAFDAALAALAGEARQLVTGSVAICAAARADGTWSGARVDDGGVTAAPAALVATLARLAGNGGARLVTLAEVPVPVRRVLPGAVDVVLAAPAAATEPDVVLAVFREIGRDDQADGRQAVLAAFAGHAALVMANARLYAEVDAALRREIDLNRQKSEFVAAVSHELRTPLTTVIGAVSTLSRLGERIDRATQAKLLGKAIDQGGRLRRLIDELLLVAAGEHCTLTADPAPADVDRVVEECVEGYGDRASGRLAVESAGPVTITTDAEKVRRIVTNLVENALKYAPGGPVTVTLDRRPQGRGVTVSVTDEGPGIPAPDRARVFEPFVQLDQSSTRRQGGTGLGLHLCKQLADLLGGGLELTESPAGGCRFALHLPDLALPPAGGPDPHRQAAEQGAFR